jgi:hypothetical protein
VDKKVSTGTWGYPFDVSHLSPDFPVQLGRLGGTETKTTTVFYPDAPLGLAKGLCIGRCLKP